jgi:hypothetical protein
MLPTTTPGKTAHQLSQEDEKLLLHVSMYKALLIRNLGNIGKEWTAEIIVASPKIPAFLNWMCHQCQQLSRNGDPS